MKAAIIGAVCSVCIGCASTQMQFTAARALNTLPDLQYQQVIDNLAMIASNPARIPYFAIAGEGIVQVTDSGESSLGMNLAPDIYTNNALGFGVSRAVTGTWNLGTITSPEKLRQMQNRYRFAVEEAMALPGQSWLQVGCKKEVPKDASCVGKYGDFYVWVMPDGMEGLSQLTYDIIDIATLEPSSPLEVRIVDVEMVKKKLSLEPPSNSDVGPPELPRTESPFRRNFQVAPRGPVFTPR